MGKTNGTRDTQAMSIRFKPDEVEAMDAFVAHPDSAVIDRTDLFRKALQVYFAQNSTVGMVYPEIAPRKRKQYRVGE